MSIWYARMNRIHRETYCIGLWRSLFFFDISIFSLLFAVSPSLLQSSVYFMASFHVLIISLHFFPIIFPSLRTTYYLRLFQVTFLRYPLPVAGRYLLPSITYHCWTLVFINQASYSSWDIYYRTHITPLSSKWLKKSPIHFTYNSRNSSLHSLPPFKKYLPQKRPFYLLCLAHFLILIPVLGPKW